MTATVPSDVMQKMGAYKHALLYAPRLESQAERALLAAIAAAIEAARREGYESGLGADPPGGQNA